MGSEMCIRDRSRPVANSCRRADVNQPLKLPRQPTPPRALTAHRRINNNTLCIHHATPAPAGSTTAKRHGVAKTSTGSSQSLWQPLGNTTRTMLPKSKCEILDDHFSIQDVGHHLPEPLCSVLEASAPGAPHPGLKSGHAIRLGKHWICK